MTKLDTVSAFLHHRGVSCVRRELLLSFLLTAGCLPQVGPPIGGEDAGTTHAHDARPHHASSPSEAPQHEGQRQHHASGPKDPPHHEWHHQPQHHAPTPHETSAPSEAPSQRRLSPEERTGWIPGTEPTAPPRVEPPPPARTTLFEDEDDTLPETPDAKQRHGEPAGTTASAKRTDPHVQQAFGTTFQNWLAQAGNQLSLDSAPLRPSAARTAPASATLHHEHESTTRDAPPGLDSHGDFCAC